MTVGRYFVLDGPDGCGKSTQAGDLVAWLRAQGADVLHLREPGSTPVGEALRHLLLSPTTGELLPLTEALLFTAARAELIARVIAPALARGTVVIAERCYTSTLTYQSLALPAATALPLPFVFELTHQAHGGIMPAAVFVLDVAPEVAQQRRRDRPDDRIEARGADYHARVRAAFAGLAAHDPRVLVIDANRARDDVQDELRARVQERLP
ncbi:MAG: dTMP kinase [Planctomycetes bacterium]|nr:dTMP kinase [Planctomycetota bacterium]